MKVEIARVFVQNLRDENVTVTITKNNINYTITLPSGYVDVVQLVNDAYNVTITSPTMKKISLSLSGLVADTIISVKSDEVQVSGAVNKIVEIQQTEQKIKEQIIDWSIHGLIFGIFSTIASFIVSIILIHLLRKRKKKVVIYKTTLF